MSLALSSSWPASKVEQRETAALKGAERNARTHSDAQVKEIAASIREWGWTQPILVDEDDHVIAGHGRLDAAKILGLAHVPVVVARGWTEVQKRAYLLADNKLALNAGWDDALLAAELKDLGAANFDLGLMGFSASELAILTAERNGGLTDPDEAPPLVDDPRAIPGEVWLLGRHRLVCGDCTDPVTVQKALAGVKPHLMVTDPPYGVKYDASWRIKAGLNGKGSAIGKVLNDDRSDWREAWALFPGSVAYVWHAGTYAGSVANSLDALKFKLRAQVVWVKTRHVMSRGDYHHQHEPCLYGVKDGADEQWGFVPEHEISTYAVKKGAVGHYVGGRKQSTVWFIEHIKSETGHSTQKPVECMKRPIENNSRPGQAIYEPFSGSGTTIIACEMTGRICHAIELNPAYVEVAIKRWEAFTGQDARRETDGLSFKEAASTTS